MAYVRLVHWNAEEAQERATRLERSGHSVNAARPNGPPFLRELTERPPDLLLIDLGRLPSQGRDVALTVRQRAGTRNIVLVFVGGDPAKVEGVRALLPDAVYTGWDGIEETLAQVVQAPPVTSPVVPASVFAHYAGRPLAGKLGIRAGTCVRLQHAPDGFRQVLGELPEGARILGRGPGQADLTVWFARDLRQLDGDMPRIVAAAASGPVWIVWPKKTSAVASDVGEKEVRRAGLDAGLVDYKVCAVDATWSGLLFRMRGAGKPQP